MTSPKSGQRDPRLDFFRGLALMIIFIAHTPQNWWAGYIPARFGLSDAADMFVFLSGCAAGIAFGGAFRRHGFAIGTARIALRCWQLWIAHILLFVIILAELEIGNRLLGGETDWVGKYNLYHFVDDPTSGLIHLMTLTYVPNFFDILPLYLMVLAMMPVAVALSRVHPLLPVGASLGLWAAAWAFGWNMPAEWWSDRPWFFNPFSWQLYFFAGFALISGWIRPPAPRPWLVAVAIAYVLIMIPISFWGFQPGAEWFAALREFVRSLSFKTDLGPLRILHFFALAWLAFWAFAGERARWLRIAPLRPIVKAGQQALSVFTTSMVLSIAGGFLLAYFGRDGGMLAAVNLGGIALLVGVAYMVGWFKLQPWKRKPPSNEVRPMAWPREEEPPVATVSLVPSEEAKEAEPAYAEAPRRAGAA